MNEIRIHAMEVGRLRGNKTFLRADGWSGLLRRRADYEFPAYAFVIEHPEGPIVVDTGLNPGARSPRPLIQRRFVPDPVARFEIEPGLRSLGLDPGEVRTVVLTHLDWDHAGGLSVFPKAEFLVHRPEWEFAGTVAGRQRFEPALWPRSFSPTLYDLANGRHGPFPSTRAVTGAADVRIVPLPGHTRGHVGVVVETGDLRVLLCGDHVLRLDWFLEDYEAGRLLGLGIWNRDAAITTSRWIHEFMSSGPGVLLPSHDDGVPARLAGMAPAPSKTTQR